MVKQATAPDLIEMCVDIVQERKERKRVKKIAVFGNVGGGNSTLSKQLADMTDLLWTPLDSLKYKPGGGEVSHAEFKAAHDALIKQDQ